MVRILEQGQGESKTMPVITEHGVQGKKLGKMGERKMCH